MHRTLDPAVTARLGKVLGMLGSDFDGERAAAAAAATRILRENGMAWSDLLVPTPALPLRPAGAAPPHVATARWALGFSSILTAREVAFLTDISKVCRITPRQSAWLADIAAKLRARDAA